MVEVVLGLGIVTGHLIKVPLAVTISSHPVFQLSPFSFYPSVRFDREIEASKVSYYGISCLFRESAEFEAVLFPTSCSMTTSLCVASSSSSNSGC